MTCGAGGISWSVKIIRKIRIFDKNYNVLKTSLNRSLRPMSYHNKSDDKIRLIGSNYLSTYLKCIYFTLENIDEFLLCRPFVRI